MIKSNIFRKKADTTAGWCLSKGLTQHAPAAAGRTHESHGQMDCRALPRTVGTQETENFSGLNLQGEIVQSTQSAPTRKAAIFLRKIFELEYAWHLRSF